MKREENMKFWRKKILKILFFSIFKKFKQHSINIKNYTAHPHDLVHVPAKFQENQSMRLWVTVRCNISRPRPSALREIKTP